MTIRAKIIGCFVVILVLFGAVSFYHYFRSEKTNERLVLVNELFLPLSRHVAQLQGGVQGLAEDVRRFYFGGGATAADSTLSRMVRDLYPYVIRRSFTEADALLFKSAGGAHHALTSELSGLLATASRTFDQLSTAADRETFEKTFRELRTQLDALSAKVDDECQKITLAAQSDGRETLITGLALSWILVGLGVITLLLSHRVLRSLPLLIENVKQMADGDFETSLKVNSGDEHEIAELARQYNRMLTALRERDGKIQQQQRDLLQSERLAAVGQLSAEIVHEIRNPLNSISLNIDWLQEELTEAEPEVSKTLGSISREVERLHQITENYLIRARFPAKGDARTPVHELIREIVDFCGEEDRSRSIKVELNLWPEELYVLADRARLKQAFLNVLRNAREAMPRGGRIGIATEIHQNVFRVKVTDSGSGMNDATRRQTFQPFFTTKPDGTGLGLMVTKSIVEEARGSITCESSIGQGTTVHFQFPA